MERALVLGASGGLGQAIFRNLEKQGVAVTGLSRRAGDFDLTDEASIGAALGRLNPPFDLIFVATGVLDGAGAEPEKTLKALTAEALVAQYAVNAIGPALILKHGIRLMPRDRRAVFAALSARVGSIGDNQMGGWYSYRAAKAGLNQLIHGAAIEVRRTHRQSICVCLHPGTVATSFTANYAARHKTITPDAAAEALLGVLSGLTPEDTGSFWDWKGAQVPW
ncbi:MAG: SDR family NAD(P)-dependent oxidoreductase [Pseudomonadota bacterium]